MIYYFSGTGNSKWIAEQLAKKTLDTAVNLMNCADEVSVNDQTIGLVFPVYAWGPPEPVLAFVKKLRGKPAFSFGVCSCGGETGETLEKLNRIFPMSGMFSVEMPNNYIIGSDVESSESIQKKFTYAQKRLDEVAKQILAKRPVVEVHQGKAAWLKSNIINYFFNRFARNTKLFYATDRCNSCGICAMSCPAKSIQMVQGKPRWGANCYQCTACINGCPQNAIEYGKATAKRKRYKIKEYIQD